MAWKSWVEALAPIGIKLSKVEYCNYAGKTGTIIEDEISKRHGLKTQTGELLAKKEAIMSGWVHSKKLPLMPDAMEAVGLCLQAGLKVVVASSSPFDEMKTKLERSGIAKLFSSAVSSDDVKRGKPFPDIYILAAKMLGLKPMDCAAFEDTRYGVEAAKSAGLLCFAVPGEFSARQDFSAADKIFKRLYDAAAFAVEGV